MLHFLPPIPTVVHKHKIVQTKHQHSSMLMMKNSHLRYPWSALRKYPVE